MPSFTILFNGLILHHHVTGANTRTAVLVDDPRHDPKLVIPSAVTPTENGWVGTVSGSERAYDLKGRTVTIKDISTSAITIDPSFAKSVPSLQTILVATDDLADEVKQKTVKKDVTTAFVEYSGGTLSVIECFESEVVFDPAVNGDPRCIGRTIQFAGSTTAGSDITIQDGLGNSIVVPDRIEIRIRNTSGGGVDHLQEYKRLMKIGTAPRRMVRTVRNCATCTPREGTFVKLNQEKTNRLLEALPELRDEFLPIIEELRGMFVVIVKSVSIECSNSQWP